MSLISIGSTSESEGVTYYDINITLPLRALTVSRRYSDFTNLVKELCEDLGISSGEFPYQLPPKGSFFTSKARTVNDRRFRLSEFLNSVVRDRDVQNRPAIHSFLQLPSNFKFTPAMFEDEGTSDSKFTIDEDREEIDKNQWLTYLRQVKSSLNEIPKGDDIASRATAREHVNKYIQPNVQKLASALSVLHQNGDIDSSQFGQRTSSLREISNETERLIFKRDAAAKKETSPHYTFSKKQKDQPKETSSTVELSNKELLQQQQQIHKDQDSEVEQLRKIIARQREIGETIGREVEEQSEMLDQFNDEVDASSDKMKDARARAKKIT